MERKSDAASRASVAMAKCHENKIAKEEENMIYKFFGKCIKNELARAIVCVCVFIRFLPLLWPRSLKVRNFSCSSKQKLEQKPTPAAVMCSKM